MNWQIKPFNRRRICMLELSVRASGNIEVRWTILYFPFLYFEFFFLFYTRGSIFLWLTIRVIIFADHLYFVKSFYLKSVSPVALAVASLIDILLVWCFQAFSSHGASIYSYTEIWLYFLKQLLALPISTAILLRPRECFCTGVVYCYRR